LLSPASIVSNNVIKEISLASEKRKKILPLDLEPVALTEDFEYQLAGLQRAPMTNIDSILRALGRLGLEATAVPTIKLVKESDARKTLMILPFEDLSPTRDNDWFADGIVAELIGAMSHVRSLRVTDPQTTKDFKHYKASLTTYAHEMGIRYFVQGSVRKMGDQLKIQAHILDIETGDYLWQDNLKGTMQDVFDIQEQVARKVVEGLNISLTAAENEKIEHKPTKNTEAYELFLKGNHYFERQTEENFERAINLWKEAVRLDPSFAEAYLNIANVSRYIYGYSSKESALLEAKAAAQKVKEIEGESALYFSSMSRIAHATGDGETALYFAKKAIALDPNRAGHFHTLYLAYGLLGMKEQCIQAIEEALRINDKVHSAHLNLVSALQDSGYTLRATEAAQKAIPIFESYLKSNPDNFQVRGNFISILISAEQKSRAHLEADKLQDESLLGYIQCYDLSCVYAELNNSVQGIIMLRRALNAGFRDFNHIRTNTYLDPLRGLPEFEVLIQEFEAKANA
jgi:adenylate cyclase